MPGLHSIGGAPIGSPSVVLVDADISGSWFIQPSRKRKPPETLKEIAQEREETQERIYELQAEAEKVRFDQGLKNTDQALDKVARQITEELGVLNALIAMETARLKELDDEETILVIMLSNPFTRVKF